jgi:hypothetical protein
MRLVLSRFRVFAALLCALAVATPALAQFGHPLKGTWTGDRVVAGEKPAHVVLELNWDGKAITGTINPGPNGVALKTATLDPDAWAVHLEADGKDAAGKAVHIVIDGKLENIGAYQRVLTGTWTEGATKGDFKVVRN